MLDVTEPALPGLEAEATLSPEADIQRSTATPELEDDGFKWEPGNPDILVPDRPALAVYINPWDQIVIRQEQTGWQDDDPYVRFDRRDVPALIKCLQALNGGAT